MGAADINAWRRQNSDPVPLVITLVDGSAVRGTILMPRDKSLTELFNMPAPFFEIEGADGQLLVISKTAVASLRRHEIPNADQLDKKLTAMDKADPWRILGIGRSASRDEIRAAYVVLARLYHPDRFASSDLPPEIAEYVDNMARRINGAYAELSTSKRSAAADDATPQA